MKKYTIYAEQVEGKAMEQFHQAMKQETTVQGALMADAHAGYTLPIGAVIATRGYVFPSYVGYDIGCGLCGVPTSFVKGDLVKKATQIMKEIYTLLPVGFHCHKKRRKSHLHTQRLTTAGQEIFAAKDALTQLGTLGGGNHFVEIGADEGGRVWILVHSGSRGFGHDLADHYMNVASGGIAKGEGHYGLDEGSEAGKNYINDLNWTLEYALENRKQILEIVMQAMGRYISGDAIWDECINRNHNHAEKRGDLWIHRKGATHAEKGMRGIIPGNIRDGSFIVEGLGNPDSLYSSSHGAGRIMGRFKAKKSLIYNDFVQDISGITARVDKRLIDESPRAYKDIFQVMKLQEKLVKTLHHIKPIINIKG